MPFFEAVWGCYGASTIVIVEMFRQTFNEACVAEKQHSDQVKVRSEQEEAIHNEQREVLQRKSLLAQMQAKVKKDVEALESEDQDDPVQFLIF